MEVATRREQVRPVIGSRTLSFWGGLTDTRAGDGTSTEEIALPNILPESESEDRARVIEDLEKMDEV